MKEDLFRVFLESEGLTANGVNSRMAKARKVEDILGQDLDTLYHRRRFSFLRARILTAF